MNPVLSNLATIALDNTILEWASDNNYVFTRFVDDLTFSSKTKPIDIYDLEIIKEICLEYGIRLNLAKTKFFHEKDLKKVTGLVLNETIDIDESFYKELEKNLKRLRHLAEVSLIISHHKQAELLREFKKEVDGQINFIGMIEGYDSSIFYQYRQKMKKALHPDEQALSARWTNSNYF